MFSYTRPVFGAVLGHHTGNERSFSQVKTEQIHLPRYLNILRPISGTFSGYRQSPRGVSPYWPVPVRWFLSFSGHELGMRTQNGFYRALPFAFYMC